MKQTVKDTSFQSMTSTARLLCQPLLEMVYVVRLVSPLAQLARAQGNHERLTVYLFREPIVACFSIYIALIYAVLYSYLIAYPIIFQEHRGWNAVQTGLALLGIGYGHGRPNHWKCALIRS